jgi:uncharacterized membrane protein YphA (DoxX/SURF4 family)
VRDYASLATRLALGFSFLYAILDRFGVLGGPGAPNVSWGSFARFIAYVGMLNWYVPKPLIPSLAVVETAIELSLALLLLFGLWLRFASLASALLLLSFAVTMTIEAGIGAPLGYSVFTASAAAFLLGAAGSVRWSLDTLFTGISGRRDA